MKTRKKPYGNSNIVGARIEQLRIEKKMSQKEFVSQLQVMGVDINPASYSKLEGQIRHVTDIELFAIAKVLHISIDELFHD